MPSFKKYITLENSERTQPEGAHRRSEKLNLREVIHVTLVVRPSSSSKARHQAIEKLAFQHPSKRKHLGIEEFTKLHGARREDLAMIKRFAQDCGLRVIESNRSSRYVVLSGSIPTFSRAFKVEFAPFDYKGHTYRSYHGAIQMPQELEDVVEAVLGLDNRLLMGHHSFMAARSAVRHTDPEEVAKAYHFPAGVNGKGQCIAIIILGGGFHREDIKEYFKKAGLHKPTISIVEINGQKNDPASPALIKKLLDAMGLDPTQKKQPKSAAPPSAKAMIDAEHAMWTIETTLDIQLAGSFANAARLVVYFAPNNERGKYHALTAALTNKKYPATVISCSWGAVEENLPRNFVHALDKVFQDAALRGITVCFSSGDKGDDPDKKGRPRVHFPASSPHVISCGGTHWKIESNRLEESVWSESLPVGRVQSGGGVSKVFKQPQWQANARVKSKTGRRGRGVPDVSGKADIATGYHMLVCGYGVTMGGTSAAAPMWAGLIARFNQVLGYRIGYLNPLLYRNMNKSAFREITEGSNGFPASPGWNPCTGLGTPIGKGLLTVLKRKNK
jgi:kumamolisin